MLYALGGGLLAAVAGGVKWAGACFGDEGGDGNDVAERELDRESGGGGEVGAELLSAARWRIV